MEIEKILVVFYNKALYTNIRSGLKKQLKGIKQDEVVIVSSTRYAAKEDFAESLAKDFGFVAESFGQLNRLGYKTNPSVFTFEKLLIALNDTKGKQNVKNIIFLFEKGMTSFFEEMCNKYGVVFTANATFSPNMNKKLGKSILISLKEKALAFVN